MIDRLTYGTAAITALFALVLFDAFISDIDAPGILGELLGKGSLIPLLFAAVSLVASLELGRLLKHAGLHPQIGWAAGWAVVLMLTPWLVSGVLLPLYPAEATAAPWHLAVLAFALGGTVLGLLRRRDLSGAIADVAGTWLIIIYAGFLPSFAVQLRCHQFLHGADGVWLLLIFLVVVKVSDIGAFFTGSAIGGPKLIPWISPKKTISGAIGGTAAAVVVALLFWFTAEWAYPHVTLEDGAEPSAERFLTRLYDITKLFHSLTITQVVLFGALMAIVGQLGDLLESVFKRAAGIKDSASIIPAFGGVLDLIDSPVLAAPVAWFLLTCLWAVV